MKLRNVSLSFVTLFVLGTLTPAFAQVTRINQGTGITLTPNPVTTTGTVSIDTTKVPLLANSNTFTANQTVNGNLTATGVVSGSAFNIGSSLFASGSYANGNAFLGFSGNTNQTDTGSGNTATGFQALLNNTTGFANTANGFEALYLNTTGAGNMAIGYGALFSNQVGNNNIASGGGALYYNTTGSDNTANGGDALMWNTIGNNNTAVGTSAGYVYPNANTTGSNNTFLGALTSQGPQTALSNATAIGANAEVTASNAMVLGSINGINNCTTANKCNSTFVGIGTTTPAYLLHLGFTDPNVHNFLRVDGPAAAGTGGYAASFGGLGAFSIDAPNIVGGRFVITESGRVGIGVTVPGHPLHMGDGAYEDHGTWTNSSDRKLKTSFAPVDGADLLVRLNAVPMSKWRYKSEQDSIRHIGPMAQDFYAAFGLGGDDKHITTVDEGGVALAAVQALYRENLKLFEATKQQQSLIQEQQAQIARLSQQVKTIQAAFKTDGRGSEGHTVRAKATVLHQ